MVTTIDYNVMTDTWYAEGPGGCHLNTLVLPDGKTLHDISYVYLHGDLEDLAGYDLICTLTENGQKPIPKVGKYPVCIAIGNQLYPSMAFIWMRKDFGFATGLVVLLDDTESMDYAEANYSSQSQRI
jgi:hypothetical protein